MTDLLTRLSKLDTPCMSVIASRFIREQIKERQQALLRAKEASKL